ncbi:cytochrome c oxidase subunit 3 [Actinomycetospora sp.]|jgi:nitric oxide reductase NorE protein|uniref:cytochrome c oxidase subunit 3 n=1 Tax=Actinomycetospora sp. TaxID=1872135 RepID=UPI002F3F0006
MAVGDRPGTSRLPGLEGVWVFIGADAVVFALLFGSFMNDRRAAPEVFAVSHQALNVDLGGLDTLILLTSSWLVALAMRALARDELDRVPRFLLGGVLTGLLFVGSKSVEYTEKLSVGITPVSDGFFMWYFVLTGIHLLHVLAGTVLLGMLWTRARRRRYTSTDRATPECVASFWHLVDLLWIVLFPLLYLQR